MDQPIFSPSELELLGQIFDTHQSPETAPNEASRQVSTNIFITKDSLGWI